MGVIPLRGNRVKVPNSPAAVTPKNSICRRKRHWFATGKAWQMRRSQKTCLVYMLKTLTVNRQSSVATLLL